jgi:hypothetical protein
MTDVPAPTDRQAALDAALERVIAAARAHLAAVKTADGEVDDDEVWRGYVALNNASYAYDEMLLDVYGEVTPWETQAIDPDADDHLLTVSDGELGHPPDPHPAVVSVRQRRDYQVPSAGGLLRAAAAAVRTHAATHGADDADTAVPETVAQAILELVGSGDGSLAALDIPELEPLDGVVTVLEVAQPLDLEEHATEDAAGPFQVAAGDRLVGRLDERPYQETDEPEEPGRQ